LNATRTQSSTNWTNTGRQPAHCPSAERAHEGIAPTLDDVASELAMSARSVQRSLRAEGTTYQHLLDDVRRELAVRHLSVRGTSAAEGAFLTGFSEPSAFSRAFRRRTGLTPGAYCAG
jgi:AraC-like DNA-binding protein